MKENDKRQWEDGFRTYLERKQQLARSTANHHIGMLKSDIVEKVLHDDFDGIAIDELEPYTYLYMLQAKVCLSGHEMWRDIWTAIDHLRHWKVGDEAIDVGQLDPLALKDTAIFILDGQKMKSDELNEVYSSLQDIVSQTYELNAAKLDKREAMLIEKERKLQQWEDSLMEREKELHAQIDHLMDIYKKVTSKKKKVAKDRPSCIRKTQSPQSIALIKERTIIIHKKHNIGTSFHLLHLMIVMRDLGFLNENVDVAAFLRLMSQWGILSEEEAQSHSIANSMHNAKTYLPQRGKLDIRCEEWDRAVYKEDRDYCHLLIDDFYEDERLAPYLPLELGN